MIGYKLFRKMKDGQLAPLFINQKQRIPLGEWLEAEDHPTKGFAHRPGWHCTLTPNAPHLSEKNRVWCVVMMEDFDYKHRPQNQGGTWALANKIRVIKEIPQDVVDQHKDELIFWRLYLGLSA